MIKNLMVTAVRHLLKKRGYSVLNIAGLAIGVACASMIFLWVEDELSFDRGFANRDSLYQVYENQTYEGKVSTFHATPGPMSAAILAEVPGVVRAFRMSGTFAELFALGDNAVYEKGDYSDAGVFQALDIKFVKGAAFSQLHSIVVNVSMAKTFFGDADPVGKTLRLNNQQDFVVSGVFRDMPKNSSFQFQWLAPMENQEHKYAWQTYWGANWAHTFVQLDSRSDRAAVDRELLRLLDRHQKNNKTVPFLFAMRDWRLRADFTDGKQAGGKIQYVRLFSFIAWIILLIACINFMNLSTARSEQRAREVGVRKVMGAARRSLIGQFILEALLLSLVAVVIAVGLVYLFVPGFNALVGKELSPASAGRCMLVIFWRSWW
ncbi:ABC transporter permease [Puia sp. P3]|uniref:ABC transporter permease n=1 Tax=Puia sp. P3 TaxID=3423952 RepID=UPI003D665595